MGNSKVSSCLPNAELRRASSDPSSDRAEEILGLLTYLKLAVEDVRAQLAAKRKDFYTIEEIADLFGRSAYTVRRWVSEGRIRAIRVEGTGPRGRLLVPRDQLDVLAGSGMASEVPAVVVG